MKNFFYILTLILYFISCVISGMLIKTSMNGEALHINFVIMMLVGFYSRILYYSCTYKNNRD